MKTFYILLLIFPSIGIAQSEVINLKLEPQSIILSFKTIEDVELDKRDDHMIDKNNNLLINSVEIKNTLVRNSDIRMYLNLVRNVSNIGMIFPKMTRLAKA